MRRSWRWRWSGSSRRSVCSSAPARTAPTSPTSWTRRWAEKSVLRNIDILGWIRIRGSMPLTNGSGSGSCYFRHYPSRCQQKTYFLTQYFGLLLFKLHLHHFSKIKSQKKSKNSRIQGFSYYFCTMKEGSGSRAGSGSIPLASGSGSGSGRPKIMWIRVRNTEKNPGMKCVRCYRTNSCNFT